MTPREWRLWGLWGPPGSPLFPRAKGVVVVGLMCPLTPHTIGGSPSGGQREETAAKVSAVRNTEAEKQQNCRPLASGNISNPPAYSNNRQRGPPMGALDPLLYKESQQLHLLLLRLQQQEGGASPTLR